MFLSVLVSAHAVFVFLAKIASSILDYRLQLSLQLDSMMYLYVIFL